MPISTRLTQLFKLKVPLVLPPMAGAAGGVLASAVAKAGGLGFIAAGHAPIAQLAKEVEIVRNDFGLKPQDQLPVGIGIIVWKMEAPHGSPELEEQYLQALIEYKPAAIWLSFGENIKEFVDKYRALETQVGLQRVPIFVMNGLIDDIIDLASWKSIDGIIVQGIESGGHAPKLEYGTPLLSLLAETSKALPNTDKIIVAAGGIATGDQVVSILPFASGAVLGTRFLVAKESLYSDKQKQALCGATGRDTVRSMNFDLVRDTLGWPDTVDGRGLRNKTTEVTEKEAASKEIKQAYDEAIKAGDMSRAIVWSGTSVGVITEVQTAQEIVDSIEKDVISALERLSRLLQ